MLGLEIELIGIEEKKFEWKWNKAFSCQIIGKTYRFKWQEIQRKLERIFFHYIPEIIAIFHLLHSQKKIKTANIYCNNKHIYFDLNEERKCHLGKQVIMPCTICLKKIFRIFWKKFPYGGRKKIQKMLISSL